MSDFLEILKKYSSDAANENGTDKNTAHSYGNVYASILSKLKEAAIKASSTLNMLEIGIYSGAFLRVLHEYIPDAVLYGIDIDISRVRYVNNIPNVHIYQLDGNDPTSASTLNQSYDLIIEDGSHAINDQIKTLDNFAPYLKSGGIYIIEDIQDVNDNVKKLKPELEKLATKHDLIMEWMDLKHIKNRYDDILVVFTKK